MTDRMADPRHPEPSGDDLRALLDEATAAARTAYHSTTRMIRLLAAARLGSSPDEVVEHMLSVLSEVFGAAITMVGRMTPDRLVIQQACGFAEHDPLLSNGLPLDRQSRSAFGQSGIGLDDRTPTSSMPSALVGLGGSAVWAPLSTEDSAGQDIVILCRSEGEPFGQIDRQVVESVADRLRSSLDLADYADTMTDLAQSSHRLVRQLDPSALLDEGVEILRTLARADGAWLFTVGRDHLPAELHKGAGGEPAHDYHGPIPPGWFSMMRGGRPVVSKRGSEHVLTVPVRRGDNAVAMLYAAREGRPFPGNIGVVASVFAGHLSAALENAELYRALGASENRLRLITEAISDMVAMIDSNGCFLYASPSFLRGLERDPERLIGSPISALAHPDERRGLEEALERVLRFPSGDDAPRDAREAKVEYRVHMGGSRWAWVESAIRTTPSQTNAVVVSTRVIDDRKQLERELVQRATHDPLTGLANRALIAQEVTHKLATRQPQHPIGLLFCDLDDFKAINDRLGHEAGDQLLVQVARRLRSPLSPRDLLGRFGGDEFVVVIDRVAHLDDVNDMARRLAAVLREPFLLGNDWVRVTASVGGVQGAPGSASMSSMLRDADAAMYTAKADGGGLVTVFDDDASYRSLDRLDLRYELSTALERGELQVHYQPICDLQTGEITGFEALARWLHPVRGWVPPDVFIPLAEQSGAIVEIGQWVLGQACRRLAQWTRPDGHRPLTMNVNLSPVQLDEPYVDERLLDAVLSNGVDPRLICLEVTEYGYLRTDVYRAVDILHRAGIRFALDDFGTSHASLSRLKWFPLDSIKIDRSFVAGAPSDDIDRSVVVGVLAIGRSLGLNVVAEGVEGPEHRAALLRLGCTSGQGYLFSAPLPAAAIEDLLHRRGMLRGGTRPRVLDSA